MALVNIKQSRISLRSLKITFKLYASLGSYLPQGVTGNIITIDVSSDMSVHDVLLRYGIPRDTVHLALLNGVYINPEERDTPLFTEGDALALWPPVAGG